MKDGNIIKYLYENPTVEDILRTESVKADIVDKGEGNRVLSEAQLSLLSSIKSFERDFYTEAGQWFLMMRILELTIKNPESPLLPNLKKFASKFLLDEGCGIAEFMGLPESVEDALKICRDKSSQYLSKPCEDSTSPLDKAIEEKMNVYSALGELPTG